MDKTEKTEKRKEEGSMIEVKRTGTGGIHK